METSRARENRLASEEMAEVLHVSARKIDHIKKRFVEEGLKTAPFEQGFDAKPSFKKGSAVFSAQQASHADAAIQSAEETPTLLHHNSSVWF